MGSRVFPMGDFGGGGGGGGLRGGGFCGGGGGEWNDQISCW